MTSLSDSSALSKAEGVRMQRVRNVLEKTFNPIVLEIEDESHRHAHHKAMVRGPEVGATETHFRVLMVSAAFDGVNRVNRSRMVHEALAPEFSSGLHALALTLRTPQEAEKVA